MLAALRAEVLVLRKWPAAWGLLAVVPALTLLTYYVDIFVLYLTVTPAQYNQEGTPSQLLPGLLPSQFVIVALTQFSFSTMAPFVVLGAVMAGGDWERGTIGTSLLAGRGRVRTGAGQALALVVALAASLAIRGLEAKAVNPLDGAMPDAWVITRGLGVALLVALAYGAMGLALGTVCRSAAGAIAVALLWTVIIEPNLYGLGLDTGGKLQAITDFLPATSASTVTGLFGSPGGGAASSVYLPVHPAVAAWTLAGYTAVFCGLTLVLLHRRDVLTGRSRRRRRPAVLTVPAGADAAPPAPAAGPGTGAGRGDAGQRDAGRDTGRRDTGRRDTGRRDAGRRDAGGAAG
jgi:ABC-2 type transport system permease protein